MPPEVRSMDVKLRARFRRRLCYGNKADLETPSLPLTDAAVDYFQDNMPCPEGLDRLDLDTASNISGQNGVSPCSMVMSVLYAKRLRNNNQKYLHSMSSSDIFFISMMMASKYLYDEGVEEEVFNDEWADATGQEVEEVNQMESNFLDAMDWRLFVGPKEFEDVLTALERRLALKEGLKRGWFTYTEMAVLLDSGLLHRLWHDVGLDVSKLATVLSTAYVASVISMIGSAAVAVQLSGPLTSATMAALSLQSSLMFGPHLASSPSVFSAKPQLHSGFMGVQPINDLDSNKSFIETPSVLQNLLLSSDQKVGEFSLSHGQLEVKTIPADLPDAKTAVGNGNRDALSNSAGDSKESSSTKLAFQRSSVLSLWFFDSLLSQIWSVLKPAPKHHDSEENANSQSSFPTTTMKNCESCDTNLGHWKSCCSCERRRACKCGHRCFRAKRATLSRNFSQGLGWCGKHRCESERRINCAGAVGVADVDNVKNCIGCDDGRFSPFSSTFRERAGGCDSSTRHGIATHRSRNGAHTACLLNAHHSQKDATNQNSGLLYSRFSDQDGKIVSDLPALSVCNSKAFFSGLPGSVLVT